MSRGDPGAARAGSFLEPGTRRLVLVCFFLSGATGLVYEGIWFRHLQGLFGVTTYALAVVVAAFMGGLAAGSWALGRAADRTPRPLFLYGVLEIGVAFLAPLVPFGIRGIEHLYVALHPALAGSLLALSSLRLLLAFAVLLLPTFLMGGTLPALTVLLRRDAAARSETGALRSSLGRLYGLNTLGALAGTLLVGFVLLERLGLWRSTCLAAAINLAVGCWCVWRGKGRWVEIDSTVAASATPVRAVSDRWLLRYAWLAFAVTGALSLAYELTWTRLLTQIIGSSTYAFSMILAAFLLGLGLGSLALSRWRGRDAAGLEAFCWAELGIGASAALVVPLLLHLPDLELRAFRSGVESLDAVLALQFGLCLLVVLVPALCMGATFPLLAGFVAARGGHPGRDIGRAYAANTLGGIAGSMLAGFVVLPHLGTQRTLQAAVLGNVTLGLVGLLSQAAARRSGTSPAPSSSRASLARIAALVLGVLLAVAAFAWRWDPYLLDTGVAVAGPGAAHGTSHVSAVELARSSDMLFYREGLNANISVRKDETQLYLKNNGKTEGTSVGDMPTQIMVGALPTLLHPEPRRALVIGLGTGASARATAYWPGYERLDVVEIEPAVVEAARRWFAAVNGGLFEDPRVHLVLEDARAFLLTTPERYDVIVSEPSNPWIAGVANLFSVEHYQRCAARLQPQGILSQWLQIYSISPQLVRMVLASIHEVFPYLQIYSFRHGDLIVLASREPIPPFDPGVVAGRVERSGLSSPLRDALGVRSAAGILGGFVLGGDDVARYAAGAPRNTEDLPRLEFEAPRSLYLVTKDINARLLLAARSRDLPALAGPSLDGAALLDVARGSLKAGRAEDAWRHAEDALRRGDSSRAQALEILGEAALGRGQPEVAAARLEEALQLDPGAGRAAQQLARIRFMQRRAGEGLALLERACHADTGVARDLEPCLQYLEIAVQSGQIDAARQLGEPLLRRRSAATPLGTVQRARLLGLVAWAHLQGDSFDEARRLAEASVALDAQSTAAWRVLGALEYRAGHFEAAAHWYRRLLDYRQNGIDVLLPLARAELQRGDRGAARRYAQLALVQDPKQPLALRLLAELR